MEKFCEILKDLIIEKGLSLRQLAKESGVSAVQYGKYLKNSMPTINVAIRISKYFKCSLDYLFGLSEVNKYKNNNSIFDISNFIKKYLKILEQNNISHWKFAKESNISESCLRHWKNGQTPKIEILLIIAEKLSISLDYLIFAEYK